MSSVTSMVPPAKQTYVPLGTTSRYSSADVAQKDAERARGQFSIDEWPNDAGFEGLTEHKGPQELEVTGNIPPWASGTLYRTGPGGSVVEGTSSGKFEISHWFDGLAHTHRFDIVTGKDSVNAAAADLDDSATAATTSRVLYSSIRQCDKLVEDIKRTGRIRAITFGQRSDPCVGLYSKFMTAFIRPPKDAPDNISVTVQANLPGFQQKLGHQGSVVLGTDSSQLLEIDPTTLQPLEAGQISHADLHPELKGGVGPAHPCVDAETGEYFSLNIEPGARPTSTYRVFRLDPTGQVTILASFTFKASYIHSFFLSPNYVVLCIPVAHYDGVHIVWRRSIVEALEPFDQEETCRWMVIDRHHGNGILAQFQSPSSFFFHTTNAFEDDNGDIICELVSFRNRAIIDALYYDVLLNRNNKTADFWSSIERLEDTRPHLVRYRLSKSEFSQRKNMPTAKKELDIPGPSAGDMPIVNPAYKGKKNRYVWSLLNRRRSTLFDAIGKTDTETGEVLFWEGPRGHTPSEAIFVGRPASAGNVVDEDDGVLLSVVLDGHNRKSYLLCLDARTMTEMGRAECEFAVGFGFHGQYLPA